MSPAWTLARQRASSTKTCRSRESCEKKNQEKQENLAQSRGHLADVAQYLASFTVKSRGRLADVWRTSAGPRKPTFFVAISERARTHFPFAKSGVYMSFQKVKTMLLSLSILWQATGLQFLPHLLREKRRKCFVSLLGTTSLPARRRGISICRHAMYVGYI